jgi:hypothetical protein
MTEPVTSLDARALVSEIRTEIACDCDYAVRREQTPLPVGWIRHANWCRSQTPERRLLTAVLGLIEQQQPPAFAVIPIRAGEDGDGELQETEIFVEGKGWCLAVDIPVGSRVTYCFAVDGEPKQSGGIHFPEPPSLAGARPASTEGDTK